jgi:hypothetical protein
VLTEEVVAPKPYARKYAGASASARNQRRAELGTGCCPAPLAIIPAVKKPERTGYQYLFGPILVGASQ